jgi:hypothetical protein
MVLDEDATNANGDETMTNATAKQTAANNAFLAKIKRIFNAKMFKRASEILNADGEDAARAFIATFYRDPTDANLDTFIAEHLDRN